MQATLHRLDYLEFMHLNDLEITYFDENIPAPKMPIKHFESLKYSLIGWVKFLSSNKAYYILLDDRKNRPATKWVDLSTEIKEEEISKDLAEHLSRAESLITTHVVNPLTFISIKALDFLGIEDYGILDISQDHDGFATLSEYFSDPFIRGWVQNRETKALYYLYSLQDSKDSMGFYYDEEINGDELRTQTLYFHQHNSIGLIYRLQKGNKSHEN